MGTKAFAKKVACAPETISAEDFESFTTLFAPGAWPRTSGW